MTVAPAFVQGSKRGSRDIIFWVLSTDGIKEMIHSYEDDISPLASLTNLTRASGIVNAQQARS